MFLVWFGFIHHREGKPHLFVIPFELDVRLMGLWNRRADSPVRMDIVPQIIIQIGRYKDGFPM